MSRVSQPEVQTDGAPKKKRTRRGTRGGRSRKTKAPAATASEETTDGDAPKPASKSRPKIHVPLPPTELDHESAADAVALADLPEPGVVAGEDSESAAVSDEQPKRKRSRRGSRGGRKRRKPAASAEPAAPETGDELAGVGTTAVSSSGNHGASAPVIEPGAQDGFPSTFRCPRIGDFDFSLAPPLEAQGTTFTPSDHLAMRPWTPRWCILGCVHLGLKEVLRPVSCVAASRAAGPF